VAELAPDLVERVVARLGMSPRPSVDPDGLATTYRAWCDAVPFDNLVKRIHLVSGDAGPIPNIDPTRFFELWLEHGTGGTCWPSSLALGSLLRALGFPARQGSCCMADTVDANLNHSHGTVLVRFEPDAPDWWVDSSMLTREPLVLRDGEHIERAHVDWLDDAGTWRVWWTVHLSADEMSCRLLADDSDVAHYEARSEWSRANSPFNTSVYASTWRDGAVRAIGRGQVVTQQDGKIKTRALGAIDDRDRVLVDELGYSEAIVARLPPDDPSPPALA
jgi:N-hydroxyarylamine O-acetyltransferase